MARSEVAINYDTLNLFPTATENNQDRLQKDIGIHPQGPVAYIIFVHFEALLKGGLVPPQHLPPAGDSGGDPQNGGRIAAYVFQFSRHIGPRTGETHLPLEYIPELGEFIQAEFTEEIPARGHAGILFQLMELLIFRPGKRILCQNLDQFFLRPDDHRAEFDHPKALEILSQALLAEKYRAGRADRHPQGQGQQ